MRPAVEPPVFFAKAPVADGPTTAAGDLDWDESPGGPTTAACDVNWDGSIDGEDAS